MIYVSLSRQYKFCHNCHPDTSFEGSMALPSGKYFVDGKSIHFNVNIASSLVGWFSVGGGGCEFISTTGAFSFMLYCLFGLETLETKSVGQLPQHLPAVDFVDYIHWIYLF
jgi:hypothetical protein